MKRIVVTGGAGFIGSHIVEHALAQGLSVTVLDNLHTGKQANIDLFAANPQYQFVHGSILDQALLHEVCQGADAVFHLAALISVPESMEKPHEYVQVNVNGTLNILEACRQQNVGSVVLSSSAAIYGDNPVVPKQETMIPEPKSPYAVTKLDGEYYFDLYCREHGIRATCLRYFNVFGPRQDPYSQYAAAVPIFIDKARRNEPITIFGDGEQTRDFVYVKDVVQANFLAAEKGQGGVFNVAWGNTMTINALAENIIQATDSGSDITHLPERPGDIKHSLADNHKLVTELGFVASSDLAQGLAETIRVG